MTRKLLRNVLLTTAAVTATFGVVLVMAPVHADSGVDQRGPEEAIGTLGTAGDPTLGTQNDPTLGSAGDPTLGTSGDPTLGTAQDQTLGTIEE